MDYATVQDVIDLWKPLSESEKEKVESMIPLVCSSLRVEANKVNKDLDVMIQDDEDLANVARSVVIDIISRTIKAEDSNPLLSQESQSALGYTWSGTYANTGGGLSILNKDLKRLGLKRQRYGVIDFYDTGN
jgi:hypothetical protein